VVDAGATNGSIAIAPVDGVDGDGGWGTNTLGWLFWNDWNAGPATEVYELLIPPLGDG
jgi:hypothetical protein